MSEARGSEVVGKALKAVNKWHDVLLSNYNAVKSALREHIADAGKKLIESIEGRLDFLLRDAEMDRDMIIDLASRYPSSQHPSYYYYLATKVDEFVLKCQIYSALFELYI